MENPRLFNLKNLEIKLNQILNSGITGIRIEEDLPTKVDNIEFLVYQEVKEIGKFAYVISQRFLREHPFSPYLQDAESFPRGHIYLKTFSGENSTDYAESLVLNLEKPVKKEGEIIIPRCEIKVFRETGDEGYDPIGIREDFGYFFGLIKKHSDFRRIIPSEFFSSKFPKEDMFNSLRVKN